MAYRVNVTQRAERDLAVLYLDIKAGESQVAMQWYAGLKVALLSLEMHPNRCPSCIGKR